MEEDVIKSVDNEGNVETYSSFEEMLEAYEKNTPWYIKFTNRAWYILKEIPYKIKCFFFPYNVIKIKSLPRTWTDRDEVLLCAAFTIFQDFVEKEGGLKDIDYQYKWQEENGEFSEERVRKDLHLSPEDPIVKEREYYEKKKEVAKIAHELYDWWMKRQKEDHWEWENQYDEETEMLVKLVKIRAYLWT